MQLYRLEGEMPDLRGKSGPAVYPMRESQSVLASSMVARAALKDVSWAKLAMLRGGELQDDFELRDPALVVNGREFFFSSTQLGKSIFESVSAEGAGAVPQRCEPYLVIS